MSANENVENKIADNSSNNIENNNVDVNRSESNMNLEVANSDIKNSKIQYLNKVAHYSLYGGLFASLFTFIFFRRIKAGIFMGLGGAIGYCRQDLNKIGDAYKIKYKKNIDTDSDISANIKP